MKDVAHLLRLEHTCSRAILKANWNGLLKAAMGNKNHTHAPHAPDPVVVVVVVVYSSPLVTRVKIPLKNEKISYIYGYDSTHRKSIVMVTLLQSICNTIYEWLRDANLMEP